MSQKRTAGLEAAAIMVDTREQWWSVGALAEAAGVTVRTLHHYDRLGILPCAPSPSGHRRYTEHDIARLYRILALRELGFTLTEIRTTLTDEKSDALMHTTRLHRQRVTAHLSAQRRLIRRLDALISRLEHGREPSAKRLFETLETMTMTVHLTRIYTRTGDNGQTDLSRHRRVPKTDPHIEALGAVDELNAAIGIALSVTPEDTAETIVACLDQIQNDLFDLGADLTTDPTSTPAGFARIAQEYITWLEQRCDSANEQLAPLRSFVLPGGRPLAAHLHLCRTICRRAERRVLNVPAVNPQIPRYLNRLSDLLFILSRAANDTEPERLWTPGRRPA